MSKSFDEKKNSVQMRALQATNWNTDGSIFHKFNSKEELELYLLRDNDGEWWDEEKGRYDFEQCEFNFEIESWAWISSFDSPVIFKLASFRYKVSFKGLTFCENADFNGCTFSEPVDFSETVFKKMFWTCSFENRVSFASANFSKGVDFWGKIFYKDANFKSAVFENGVSFAESVFYGEFCFSNTRILNGGVSFEEVEFKKKVNAWDITCAGDMNFQWANFRDKATFSELNVRRYRVNFYGTNFEGNVYFYDSRIGSLELSKSVIEKGLYFLDSEINKGNRETWRIIKHQFLKQDNRIEALKYYKREMSAYELELFGEKQYFKFSIVRFFRDFIKIFSKGERINKFIVFINRISNEFNSNPFRGIGFTLLSTLIFYWLFLFILKLENHISFTYSFKYLGLNIKQLLQLLNVTDWNYHPFCLKYNWAYSILFIGRIIIGFGLYQTIQSFRKFGKP